MYRNCNGAHLARSLKMRTTSSQQRQMKKKTTNDNNKENIETVTIKYCAQHTHEMKSITPLMIV